ncbi:shikimate dehydrogenase [Syntrophotalea acetylenica]|uniref:Shikimate dehydrogenase (NADP(+)) n=1 Tax=Syntrophotalea acetylenica TaxID=29542 RepID=A0A1L3GHH7_SYNAC|nr:shikimate dehydrogenase [Syntrophotalea acetylenica]APG25396.1 shikimate dehydrogenase [Syntrophotalea acetylenica]APG43463.1 shikimate dehydrogenase [Syntrophotalea acetylenica]MDY0262684.1 shikimate dehydrogenase [Syntrophotalea acetylenica]
MMIRGTTRVFGIFGHPVDHSLSPLMHNAAFRALGMDAVYVPFAVAPVRLGEAVAALRALRIAGVNVTIPHKETVLAYLDEVDAAARLIGAVNTVHNRDGYLVGYNTDGTGLIRSLAADLAFDPAGKRVLLLGAGGASRAALVALAETGAAWIGVANRTRPKAENLVAEFRDHFPGTDFAVLDLAASALAAVCPSVNLLLNGTSIGLKGEVFDALPWQQLNRAAVVCDIVYRSPDTPLVMTARSRGHRATGGLGMLIAQGEAAFRIWTGQEPPAGVMRQALAR